MSGSWVVLQTLITVSWMYLLLFDTDLASFSNSFILTLIFEQASEFISARTLSYWAFETCAGGRMRCPKKPATAGLRVPYFKRMVRLRVDDFKHPLHVYANGPPPSRWILKWYSRFKHPRANLARANTQNVRVMIVLFFDGLPALPNFRLRCAGSGCEARRRPTVILEKDCFADDIFSNHIKLRLPNRNKETTLFLFHSFQFPWVV